MIRHHLCCSNFFASCATRQLHAAALSSGDSRWQSDNALISDAQSDFTKCDALQTAQGVMQPVLEKLLSFRPTI